jgi:DNA-binding beta-propeller fold protein YncE
MKTQYRPFIRAIVLTFLAIVQVAVCKADGPYHFVKEIPLSGTGGCNFLLMDEPGRRLYIVCTNQITVLDLGMGQVVGTITNASGVRGFAVADRVGRGFLSDGQEPKMSIIDLRTYKTVMKIDTGRNPAAILIDPSRMDVYAFNQGDDSASVYEADDGDFVKNIKLTGKPGLAVVDPKAGRIYCAIEDKNEIDVIDTRTHTVTNHWPIMAGVTVSGIASDPLHHRLFLGCTNKVILMVDSTNGRVLDTLPTDQGVGFIAFDPTRRFIVGSAAEGTVSVAGEYTLENLKMLQTLEAGHAVCAMVVDPKTGRIYLATGEKILVYGVELPPHQ